MVMSSLLLKKSSRTSKSKDHTECLKWCLQLWKGNFDKLVREVRFIQAKLTYQRTPVSLEQIARKFNDFMIAGKVNLASRFLSSLLGYFRQIKKPWPS